MYGRETYQSMLCGGSSLAWLVLTVSDQPVDTCQQTVDMNVPRSTRDSGVLISPQYSIISSSCLLWVLTDLEWAVCPGA